MILTLYLLLMPVYIILIFPKNFTIFLQQYTIHSATIQNEFMVSITNLLSLIVKKKLNEIFNN